MDLNITDTSKAVFFAYAKDAGNWNGSPLVGGNVGGGRGERGNLTQLKQAGLIETQVDEGKWPTTARYSYGTYGFTALPTWIHFTALGREYARELGVRYI
jgi:hypothetical protein